MGTCKICGLSAGWFKEYHAECQAKFNSGRESLISTSTNAILIQAERENLMDRCKSIAQHYMLSDDAIRDSLITSWEKTLENLLDNGILSQEEEGKLMTFAEEFGFGQYQLDRKGQYTRAIKAAVLREVTEGIIPQRFKVGDNHPFNLQKTETLVWAFNDVSYLEEKTSRTYVGASQGMSIRVGKGVYYRVGAFEGHPVETTQMVYKGKGVLAITTKHIYFASETLKSVRIPYNKIISWISFSDGIGIHTDAKSSKPIAFVNGDGWFIFNLVQNLAQM